MTAHDTPEGWTTSDALLLLSVGRRRGVSIDSLLSTTDARDTSVPSETESAVGLGTLMASGLVEIVEGGFCVTPRGRALIGQLSGRDGIVGQVGALQPFFEGIQRIEGIYLFAPGEYAAVLEARARRPERRRPSRRRRRWWPWW